MLSVLAGIGRVHSKVEFGVTTHLDAALAHQLLQTVPIHQRRAEVVVELSAGELVWPGVALRTAGSGVMWESGKRATD